MVKGGNGLSGASKLAAGISEDIFRGFGYLAEPEALPFFKDEYMCRDEYISMFGPTVGDRIRLGDTSLWVQIERDYVSQIITRVCLTVLSSRRLYMAMKSSLGVVSYAVMVSRRCFILDPGKTIRDGMGQASGRTSEEALDLVITNAVIIDWTGIYKVTRRFCGFVRPLIGS